MTYKAFVLHRLGISRTSLRQVKPEQRRWFFLWSIFCRPFTAPSLQMFWQYWNPVYAYFLGLYVFRPCRRYFSYGVSVILTFAFCGFFLHDVLAWPLVILSGNYQLPLIMTWFIIIACGLLITERFRFHFGFLRASLRPLVHICYLVASYLLARFCVDGSKKPLQEVARLLFQYAHG